MNNGGIYGGGGDRAEGARREIWQSTRGIELRVVERVEEFGPELECVVLENPGRLQDRNIEVELSRSVDDAGSGVAEYRATGNSRIRRGALRLSGTPWDGERDGPSGRHCWRRDEGRLVEPALPAACAPQPLLDTAGGREAGIGYAG